MALADLLAGVCFLTDLTFVIGAASGIGSFTPTGIVSPVMASTLLSIGSLLLPVLLKAFVRALLTAVPCTREVKKLAIDLPNRLVQSPLPSAYAGIPFTLGLIPFLALTASCSVSNCSYIAFAFLLFNISVFLANMSLPLLFFVILVSFSPSCANVLFVPGLLILSDKTDSRLEASIK